MELFTVRLDSKRIFLTNTFASLKLKLEFKLKLKLRELKLEFINRNMKCKRSVLGKFENVLIQTFNSFTKTLYTCNLMKCVNLNNAN